VARSLDPNAPPIAAAADLQRHLLRLKELRGKAARKPARLAELKRWQAERLVKSYGDFASEPRFADATAFFVDDLYGVKDFSERDQEMLRILPVMTRILPASAVDTASRAIELEALSEDLDQRTAAALGNGPITDASYGEAYRAASTPAERLRQIDLIDQVGRNLDVLVAKPFVGATLKLMRKPARVAGLGDLQDFLERGYEAFRRMKGADDFLGTLRRRETAILNRLFSGKAEPFAV
jgi:hypothetical protein